MSEHNIIVEGGTSVRLKTAGKYCDRDILITADGGGDTEIEDAFVTRTLTEYRNDRVKSVGNNAFQNVTTLTSISLPMVNTLGINCFSGCNALVNVDLPNATTLHGYAFSACSALKSVSFPLVENLGTYVFYNCTSLEVIDFSTKVSLPGQVFGGCSALKALILRSTQLCPMSASNAITTSAIGKGTGYVYVPRTLADGSDGVEAYKATTNWSTYADQIRAIEDYPEITGG